jgi:vacuolar-type H+-ATPase subunit F/Vma7
MSIHALGDRTLVEAFELIGVPGTVTDSDRDIAGLLDELARAHHARLLLVQDSLLAPVGEAVLDRLARECDCLVLEIPGVGKPPPDQDRFRRVLRSSIGTTL